MIGELSESRKLYLFSTILRMLGICLQQCPDKVDAVARCYARPNEIIATYDDTYK